MAALVAVRFNPVILTFYERPLQTNFVINIVNYDVEEMVWRLNISLSTKAGST
jgi:hypothetical protein